MIHCGSLELSTPVAAERSRGGRATAECTPAWRRRNRLTGNLGCNSDGVLSRETNAAIGLFAMSVRHGSASDACSEDGRLPGCGTRRGWRRRGRQWRQAPAGGIGPFGIEPMPEERKRVGWSISSASRSNFLIHPRTMFAGGLAVAAGLSFQASCAAGFLGTA